MTPFDWKFLQIGTLRAKDLRKNQSKLRKRGFTPAPLTLLAIRVVSLHKLRFVQSFNSPTVCTCILSNDKFSKVSLVSLFFLRWLERWFNLIVLITDKSILALKCHHYVVTSSENFNRRMGREFFIKNLQALITRFFTHAIY